MFRHLCEDRTLARYYTTSVCVCAEAVFVLCVQASPRGLRPALVPAAAEHPPEEDHGRGQSKPAPLSE